MKSMIDSISTGLMKDLLISSLPAPPFTHTRERKAKREQGPLLPLVVG